jgi:hypothetical protein
MDKEKELKETQPIVYNTPMTSTVMNGIKIGSKVVKSLSVAGTADSAVAFTSSDNSIDILPTSNGIDFKGHSMDPGVISKRYTKVESLRSIIDATFTNLNMDQKMTWWAGHTGQFGSTGATLQVDIPLVGDKLNHKKQTYLAIRCPTFKEMQPFWLYDQATVPYDYTPRFSNNMRFVFTTDRSFSEQTKKYQYFLYVNIQEDPEEGDSITMTFTWSDIMTSHTSVINEGSTLWLNLSKYPPYGDMDGMVPPTIFWLESVYATSPGHDMPEWAMGRTIAAIYGDICIVTDYNPTKWMETFK